jgi:hypothetical protein
MNSSKQSLKQTIPRLEYFYLSPNIQTKYKLSNTSYNEMNEMYELKTNENIINNITRKIIINQSEFNKLPENKKINYLPYGKTNKQYQSGPKLGKWYTIDSFAKKSYLEELKLEEEKRNRMRNKLIRELPNIITSAEHSILDPDQQQLYIPNEVVTTYFNGSTKPATYIKKTINNERKAKQERYFKKSFLIEESFWGKNLI